MRWGVIADRLDVPKFHDSLATSHARYYDCIMTYGINVLLMQQYIIVLYVRCTYGWCWSPVTTITSRFINTMNLTSIQSVHTLRTYSRKRKKKGKKEGRERKRRKNVSDVD